MYEIKIPLFPLIFFKFHNLKDKTYDFIDEKYSFEFLALSYMKNKEITNYDEIKRIFPQLIPLKSEFAIDEDRKLIGVFTYNFQSKNVRLAIIIQISEKNFNFRIKMKRKTQIDFYESVIDKKELINELKSNIIEEFFANFIKK